LWSPALTDIRTTDTSISPPVGILEFTEQVDLI